MGITLLEMPRPTAEALPDRLREAGLEVEIKSSKPNPTEFPDFSLITAICSRGKDSQYIEWYENPDDSNEFIIHIHNAWAWRKHVKRRREQLQADVTHIILRNGGYEQRRTRRST